MRVAVVGAGPAGLYAADYLSFDQDGSTQVDLFERLPAPFGLLRYGVAPDHLNIKAAGRALMEVLQRDGVQLLAGVAVGEDVTVAELREHYDAVIYAVGASDDRRIGIPGEDLPGSISATSFVNWYNGHPEASGYDLSDAHLVAVVGVGNVALDVARMLLKDAEDLSPTDVPEPVLEALRRSSVTDVHVLGRRGPQHAKFTFKELRELGELPGTDVVVNAGSIPSEVPADATPATKRNLKILREWAAREPSASGRRLHLHFGARPAEVLGTGRVTGLRLERTDSEGVPTGATWELPVDRVFRSVGYRSTGLPGVPFDDATCTIPTESSRVVRDGVAAAGEYAVGWIKRGPTGILGSNRADAEDAVVSLRADQHELIAARTGAVDGVADLLRRRGVRVIDTAGWSAILEAEELHGVPHGRGRVKIHDWETLLGLGLGRKPDHSPAR
jgi:ferredoxin--NADP+ reductase